MADEVAVELVPGGTARVIERAAGRMRVRAEWPLPPTTVVRVRGCPGEAGLGLASVAASELVAVIPDRPPLYEAVLAPADGALDDPDPVREVEPEVPQGK